MASHVVAFTLALIDVHGLLQEAQTVYDARMASSRSPVEDMNAAIALFKGTLEKALSAPPASSASPPILASSSVAAD